MYPNFAASSVIHCSAKLVSVIRTIGLPVVVVLCGCVISVGGVSVGGGSWVANDTWIISVLVATVLVLTGVRVET